MGASSLEKKKNLSNKPQPLNVTSSTNKPNLKVLFVFGGAAEKDKLKTLYLCLISEARTLSKF